MLNGKHPRVKLVDVPGGMVNDPNMSTEELVQRRALYMSEVDARHLLHRLRNSRTLITYGVEVYTVEAEPILEEGGDRKVPAVGVMVRAETNYQCGLGVGYVLGVEESRER